MAPLWGGGAKVETKMNVGATRLRFRGEMRLRFVCAVRETARRIRSLRGIDTVPDAVTLPLGVMWAWASVRPLMPMMMPVNPSTRAAGTSPGPPTRMES